MTWNNSEVSLDIKIIGTPAVASWKEGRLDVFVCSFTDNHLYHRVYESGLWHGTKWDLIAGPASNSTLVSSPAAVSWGSDRIDLFAVWNDKHLSHLAWDGSSWQTKWDDLGGTTNDAPAAASWKKMRMDVFIRTTDNNISRRYWEEFHVGLQNTSWEDWHGLGGGLMSAPTAAASALQRIDCFGADKDGHLMHMLYDGRNDSPLAIVDGVLKIKGAPAAASAVTAADGRVDVFVRDANDLLKHRVYFNNGWEAGKTWDDVSTQKIFSAPAAAACWDGTTPKRFDCFAQGADNFLFHTWWAG